MPSTYREIFALFELIAVLVSYRSRIAHEYAADHLIRSSHHPHDDQGDSLVAMKVKHLV